MTRQSSGYDFIPAPRESVSSSFFPSTGPTVERPYTAYPAPLPPLGPALHPMTWVAVVFAVAGTGITCWGTYRLIAHIDPIGFLFDGTRLIAPWSIPLFGAGAIILLVAFILSLVALFKSRRRLLPALVAILLLVFPPAGVAFAASEGSVAAQETITADVKDRVTAMTPEQLDEFIVFLEDNKTVIPGAPEVIDILNRVKNGVDVDEVLHSTEEGSPVGEQEQPLVDEGASSLMGLDATAEGASA